MLEYITASILRQGSPASPDFPCRTMLFLFQMEACSIGSSKKNFRTHTVYIYFAYFKPVLMVVYLHTQYESRYSQRTLCVWQKSLIFGTKRNFLWYFPQQQLRQKESGQLFSYRKWSTLFTSFFLKLLRDWLMSSQRLANKITLLETVVSPYHFAVFASMFSENLHVNIAVYAWNAR